MTFDTTCDCLIASYTVDGAGRSTAVFLFDGIEITAAEYDAIQIAALDRFCNGIGDLA